MLHCGSVMDYFCVSPQLYIVYALGHRQKLTRASGWHAIAYPHAGTIAYLHVHQTSNCVPPVLIHRSITRDSFKVLTQKPRRSCVTIKKKRTQNPTFDLWWPRHAPGAKLLQHYILHFLWFDVQHDCLYKMDPLGPPPHRGYIKIPNVFLQFLSIGYRLWKFSISSLNGLGAMVWHYRRTDGQTDGRGYHNIPTFSSKSAGIKKSCPLRINVPFLSLVKLCKSYSGQADFFQK